MDRSLAQELINDWHERGAPELVHRAEGIDLPMTKKVISIIGPRRAGKTYLMYDIVSNVLPVPPSDTLFVNLEDHRLQSPTVEALDLLVRLYYEQEPGRHGRTVYLFLDEVQNVFGWEGFVRSMMDRENVQIFVSGSSSKLLSKEIATSLRGRSLTQLVLPFSFGEVLKVRGISRALSSRGKSNILNGLVKYLRYGGFPEVVLEDVDLVREKTLHQYVDVMLFRDIVDRYNVTNVKVLRLLMGQMISSSAALFSVNRFHNFLGSQGLKIDKNAIYEYRDHLVDAFGFIELKKVHGSYRSVEQGLPKIYPIDTGYLTVFGMDAEASMGKYMESCIAVELVRRGSQAPGQSVHYWRDGSGNEVDFVIMKRGRPERLIQSCFDVTDEKTYAREMKGLVKGSTDLKCEELVCINWGVEKEEFIDGLTVRFIPLWKWLLYAEPY
jgi:predicted AAA+ superfamily ATPase